MRPQKDNTELEKHTKLLKDFNLFEHYDEWRCRGGSRNLHKRNPIIKHHVKMNQNLFSHRSPIMDFFWSCDVLRRVKTVSWDEVVNISCRQSDGVHRLFAEIFFPKSHDSRKPCSMKHRKTAQRCLLTDNNFSWLNHKRVRAEPRNVSWE